MKKVALCYVALTFLVGAFLFAVPKYRYTHGHTYKVLAVDGIQPTDEEGFALHLTIQDCDGNIYDARTGFVAEWDTKEDNYINAKRVTLLQHGYYADGIIVTADGNMWEYHDDRLINNADIVVKFDNNGTANNIYDDIIGGFYYADENSR